MNIKGLNAFQLKVIALITMTIDHIGVFIFPDVEFLRIIGRISFVIFAFFIGNAFIYTKNRKKFAIQLSLVALIFEIVLFILNVNTSSSIFLTLALGYNLIYVVHERKYWLAIPILIIPYFYNVDYSYYGILLVYAGYYFHDNKIVYLLINIALCMVFTTFSNISIIQYYSIIGCVLLLFYNEKEGFKLKYFFYLYYPLHIILLSTLSYYISFA
ncbi:MAG: TraX family protein [Erysipelotrichales bacterium]